MVTPTQFAIITNDLNELLAQDDIIISILTSMDTYVAQFTNVAVQSTPYSLRTNMKEIIQSITDNKPQNSYDARGVNPFIDALIGDIS